MDTFSKRLEWAMEKSGVGIPELAKVGDVSRAAIYQWKSEETTDHKAGPLLRMAARMRVDPYWLEFGTGTPEAKKEQTLDPSLVAYVLRFADTLYKYPIGHRMTLDDKVKAAIELYKDGHGTIRHDEDVTATATQVLLEILPTK